MITENREVEEAVFLLEIAYKSGYAFRMWFTKFVIDNGNWSWSTPSTFHQPIKMNVNEIVSCIQIDVKELNDLTNEDLKEAANWSKR